MKNIINKRNIIISAVILALTIIFISTIAYSNQTYITEIRISPDEAFKVSLDNKTINVKDKTLYELKAGRVLVKVENVEYNNFSETFEIKRNNNNLISIDMNRYKPVLKSLGEIKGINEEYANDNILKNVEYINDQGYWVVVVGENKVDSRFSIFAAKREGNEWVIKSDIIFKPDEINDGVKGLPSVVKNFFINDSINYFGELG